MALADRRSWFSWRQRLSNTCDLTGRNEVHRPLVGGIAALILFVAGSLSGLIASDEPKKADPNDPALIARGKVVYTEYCASCHGANLEGQPNWRKRLPTG